MTPMSGDYNTLYRIISIDLEDSVKTKKNKKKLTKVEMFSQHPIGVSNSGSKTKVVGSN